MSSADGELRSALVSLLAMCDRMKAEMRHGPVDWDERKPTIFYLNRNMEDAREVLAGSAPT